MHLRISTQNEIKKICLELAEIPALKPTTYVSIRGHTYFIGLVYRPQNSNITEFSNAMHSILDKIASRPCYIMGDYNLDLLKHEIHHPTENFLDIMYANYLVPLINRPTRITRESSTLIDNIFSNNYNVIDYQVNGILKTDITDHYIIFHLLSLKVEKNLWTSSTKLFEW